MVNVIIDQEYITFKIVNNGEKDLKRFYSVEYFEFIGLNPEIYITPQKGLIRGGHFEDIERLTVPYRFIVKFIEKDSSNLTIRTVQKNKLQD